MNEQFLTKLEELTDYEEVFHFVKGVIQTECELDGMSIIVHDREEEKYILMPEDLQWRDMPALPESFVQKTFEADQAQIIDEPISQTLCNQSIDCNNEEDTSALLLFPILNKDDRYDIVLSLWKVYEKEKEEIIEPLIVGSQMIGSRTHIKSTMIHRTFEKENIDFLRSVETMILLATKKLAEQIEVQKNAVLNRIKENEQVFKTPQEIIAALINILMGTNASLVNIKEIIKQLKQHIHRNDRNMPHIVHIEDLIEQLNENLLHSFQFTTTNNVIDELFKGKKAIETKPFFEHFATTAKELICYKNISMLFFLDTRLPVQIKIDKQNTYIFLSEILQFALNHTIDQYPFEMHIVDDPKNNSSILLHISYATNTENIEEHRTLFMLIKEGENPLENTLRLAYKHFLQTGGKAYSNIDAKRNRISFSISIPYEVSDASPIVTPISNQDLKIGLLLDKDQDIYAANNIARYLLSLGISKSQLIGTVQFELLQDDLTHLIVFQSQFSDELFNNKLQHKPYPIMTVVNGCNHDAPLNFYNYSVVDMEIDRNQPYLETLEEFLQMECN